jgi:ABC-type multidrug transport system fused ATPase/permease subunit
VVSNIIHNLKNAAVSDRIIVLSAGGFSALGSHAELMNSENLCSAAWQGFMMKE